MFIQMIVDQIQKNQKRNLHLEHLVLVAVQGVAPIQILIEGNSKLKRQKNICFCII